MEQESTPEITPTQVINTDEATKIELEEMLKEIQGGTNWFYWIGGLSLINSLFTLFGKQVSFSIGLGITQFIDGIFLGIFGKYSMFSFFINLFVIGCFIAFGYFSARKNTTILLVGVVVYILDGLIFLYFGAFLPVALHGLALFYLIKSYLKLQEYGKLEATLTQQ